MGHKINIDRSKLHPWLNYKLQLFLDRCAKKGLYVIVTCGYRSFAEQDKLYAQGRTTSGNRVTNAKGGYSQHNWGIAFDIAMNYDVDKDGKITDDTWNVKGFQEVAKIAKKVGLAWGGDWKSIVDRPHFYLSKWGDTTTELRNKYGTVENFKKTWKKRAIRVGGVKMRKTKFTTSKVVGVIPRGNKMNVLWEKKKYAKVEYNGVVGYVRQKYVE